jgi:hypothetical protein
LALARAEAQNGNTAAAENSYQHAEHSFAIKKINTFNFPNARELLTVRPLKKQSDDDLQPGSMP